MRGGLVLFVCLLCGCSSAGRQLTERRETCHSLCQQARTAKSEGWPDQADLLLNEAVRQRPDDLETRRQLAEAMWECGRQQDAIDEYQELAKSHSRDARLQQRLAVLAWTTGQRELAAQAADRTLRLNPTSAEALLVKARSEAARRDFDAAMATYIRLGRAAPELIDAKLELAEVHLERGHSHQACQSLRDVMTHPQLTAEQKADAEWKLGLAYATNDRWSEAATHLGNSVEKRPSTAADWQILLTAKQLAGQESSELQSKAVLASAQQSIDEDASVWSGVRDRLIVRGGLMIGSGGVANNSVIRADFVKNASREP
jgi:tetratricopeptide (TPR) repeat protein